jgi:ABC-type sugar transport system substrate-binding protein
MRRTTVLAAAVASLALLTSACGSSGGGSSSVSGSGSAGISEATKYLDSVSSNPDGIGLDVPLSKKPEAGKTIINLITGEPVAKVKSDAMKAAAEALGWNYETIAVGNTAEGAQQAMQSAIEKKPDGISFSGFPSSAFGTSIDAAKKAGIPLLADTVVEDAKDPIISTSLDNATQVSNWGKMVAAQFVVDSKGKGEGATFTMTEYPILVAWQKAVKKYVDEWCPDCKLTAVATPATDIGTKMPASVVSTLQRNPNIKYAMFSIGDQTLGLAPALKGAGLTDTKVLGETPAEANIEALKAGTESAWTGFPSIILGWRIMDMWARHFNGDDLAPANEALLPLQMLTKSNINDAVLTDAGNYYVGYADYESAFKKLWKVG